MPKVYPLQENELKEFAKHTSPRDLYGIIIGIFDENGRPYGYWSEDNFIRQWKDDFHAEAPIVYRKLHIAKKRCLELKEHYRNSLLKDYIFQLCFWVHSECNYAPVEKYLKMDGHRYSGSPRR